MVVVRVMVGVKVGEGVGEGVALGGIGVSVRGGFSVVNCWVLVAGASPGGGAQETTKSKIIKAAIILFMVIPSI